MSGLEKDLARRLEAIRQADLLRTLHVLNSAQGPRVEMEGERLINFSSNDYLGLANDPVLKEAARRAVERYGVGAGASRLVCGSMAPHHQLEEALAQWKRTEAALSFGSGYATAVGTLTALLEKGDIVMVDKLVHACIVDAARLSGAKLRVFPHNNLDRLERLLQWADRQAAGTGKPRPRVVVATESVFSMDGDLALLKDMVELKNRYGAWLFLDEAHATGLFGEGRRGLAEAFAVADQVEIQMGTLGKSLGAAGGYICGSRRLIDFLAHRARSFVFTTAPSPVVAAAATAAVELVRGAAGERRRTKLWLLLDELKSVLIQAGLPLPPIRSAIVPLHIGGEAEAVAVARALRERGCLVPAIRYPTVARGSARLRLTLTAAHELEEIEALGRAVTELERTWPPPKT